MRLLAMTQGPYGERIVRNIRETGPDGWAVEQVTLARGLPPFIDEPADFLPAHIPQADLLLGLGESSGAAQLLLDAANRAGTHAVIAPVDNSAWLPQGLANQLKREFAQMGIVAIFPRPFCSLTEISSGYGRSAEPYESAIAASFARHFGKPGLRIKVNAKTKQIEHVEVTRNSACGSAYHVARGLPGLSADAAAVKAGLILHHFPCLCSMNKEWIDDRLHDTLMHVSGYIVNEHVTEQLRPYMTPAQYLTPPQHVD